MELKSKFVETSLKKSYVYKGRILNLRVDDVILPDGKEAKREIIEHSGGAAVLVEKEDSVLFVKQYRYAFEKEVYEIPAGKLNLGEEPKVAARRELEEECGYKASDIKKLCSAYATPGYSTEIIHIFRADGITETQTHLDEDEFLTSEWIKKDRIKQMIANGEICDAKTLIALSYLTDL